MENNNLNNNQNLNSNNVQTSAPSSASSFSGTNNSTTSQVNASGTFTSTSSTNVTSQKTTQTTNTNFSSGRYLRPEDIVKGGSDNTAQQKSTPVFAYSQNPYMPSGQSSTNSQNSMQSGVNAGFTGQNQVGGSQSFGINQTPSNNASGGDLSFGANQPDQTPTSVSSGFEVVGNKVSAAKSKKVNMKKLNASRIKESRFCGHFAWFFSVLNMFVCLFFILIGIMKSNIAGSSEEIEKNSIATFVNKVMEISPYVTLVVCAFTLIAIINSIIQLTIRVNKYSKLTICIVLVLSIVAFVYLFLAGYISQTLALLSIVTT